MERDLDGHSKGRAGAKSYSNPHQTGKVLDWEIDLAEIYDLAGESRFSGWIFGTETFLQLIQRFQNHDGKYKYFN